MGCWSKKLNRRYKALRANWIVMVLLGALVGACQKDVLPDADPRIVATPCFTTPSPENGRVIEGEYLVVCHGDAPGDFSADGGRWIASSEALLLRYGIPSSALRGTFSGIQRGFLCRLSPRQAEQLRHDPTVVTVEPDRVISIAACVSVVDTHTIAWGVRRTGYGDGTGKTAWIIDTGIESSHPDLTVDRSRSRCFIEGQSSFEDENGHGTHVAGIIGALNNQEGTLGVASGAHLVALKVLNQLGEGRVSTLVKALNYVNQKAQRGDVVNISLVGDTISPILDREVAGIADKGVMFAIAAGNQGREAGQISPSRVNHPNVYTVSAMDERDTWAGFSNFGKEVVDVSAPGVMILSTGLSGGYAYMSGTSLATPHVAGILLLDGRHFSRDGFVLLDPDGQSDPIAHKR